MKISETRIPILRFPGFTGEWEEKKINEIVTRYVNPVEVEEDQYYREIGIRSHGKGIFHKEKIKGKELGNKRVFWVKENAFVVNIVFAWERAVAKTSENEKGFIASHRFPMYLPKDNKSSIDYLLHFFLTDKGKIVLELASPGGAGRNKTLGQVEFGKSKIILPSLTEQEKIAAFLSSIDNRIKLLKEKRDKLEEYKRGVMQQIFSKELRFTPSDDSIYSDWEKRKLGEVGIFQTSSIDKLSKVDEQEVYLVNYMNVYKHEKINNQTKSELQIVTATNNQISSCDLRKGDILFTPSSETPEDIGHSVVIFETLKNTVYSYHLMRFRPKIEIDTLYSHYFCNAPQVLKQLSKLATGSTRFTISVKAFSSVEVSLPCLKEQRQIANFLSVIDNKIVLFSKQIVNNEEYKKGIVQQLFV